MGWPEHKQRPFRSHSWICISTNRWIQVAFPSKCKTLLQCEYPPQHNPIDLEVAVEEHAVLCRHCSVTPKNQELRGADKHFSRPGMSRPFSLSTLRWRRALGFVSSRCSAERGSGPFCIRDKVKPCFLACWMDWPCNNVMPLHSSQFYKSGHLFLP